jgi:hypothetical protein
MNHFTTKILNCIQMRKHVYFYISFLICIQQARYTFVQ